MPLQKRRAAEASTKAKRPSIVQVPTSDLQDIRYVRFFLSSLIGWRSSRVLQGVAMDIGGEHTSFAFDTGIYLFSYALSLGYSLCFEGSCDMWTITPQCKTPDGQRCNADDPINHGYTLSKTFKPRNLTFFEQYGPDDSPSVASGWLNFILRFLACFTDCLFNRHDRSRYCQIWRFEPVTATFCIDEYVFIYCNVLPLAYPGP